MTSDSGSRMVKYGVAALLLGLYAVVSAWIVAGEGEAYRNGLRRPLASRTVPAPPTDQDGRRTSPEIKPPPSVAEAPPVAPSPTIPPGPKSAPSVQVDRTHVAEADGAPGPIARAPAPNPPPAPAAAPPIDPFWELPDQKKSWDLDHLTPDGERELGMALNRMIRKFHPPLEDGPLPRRLEDAAEPYLKTCDRKDVTYTFTVLDCDCSNVFSHPGGYVYACRGLFDWIAEDEDYALEFALAHEMAHVDLAHAINCLRDPDVKKLQLGTVPLFYLVVIPWGYKPEQDLAADKWAWERLSKRGRSRYESLAFLRKLEDYSRKNGFENVPKKPIDEPKLPLLDNHIRTHPIPRKRLKDLKSMIDLVQKI